MATLRARDQLDNNSFDFLFGRFSFSEAQRVSTGPQVITIDWDDGATSVVRGQGFQFDGDQPVSGQVARIDIFGADGPLDVRYIVDSDGLSGRQLGELFEEGSFRDASRILFGGDDVIIGSGGDDDLDGFRGNDVLRGRGGDDTLAGGGGDDIVRGNNGDDTLFGRGGEDVVVGGGGDDRVVGNGGSDRLFGGSGEDSLSAGGGGDRLRGGGDNDSLFGGNGADLVLGGGGNDFLFGGGGRDILRGGAGADNLNGDAGTDNLIGGGGNDRLSASEGPDTMRGGPGEDTFSFGADSIGLYEVLDFEPGEELFIRAETFEVTPTQNTVDDFVRIDDQGDDAVIQVDTDGAGDTFAGLAILVGNAGIDLDFFVADSGTVLIS